MQHTQAISQLTIKTKSIATVNFTVLFVILSVALPWLAHHFKLAGPTFLPMHFFVLFAGLLLGWRTGFIVGLFTPLISYAVSSMPPLMILPQTVIEVAMYGLIAGLAREKFHLNLYWSLLIALFVGRLGVLMGILIFSHSAVQPLTAVMQSIKIGWPGLLIQLSLIPLLVSFAKRYFETHDHQNSA